MWRAPAWSAVGTSVKCCIWPARPARRQSGASQHGVVVPAGPGARPCLHAAQQANATSADLTRQVSTLLARFSGRTRARGHQRKQDARGQCEGCDAGAAAASGTAGHCQGSGCTAWLQRPGCCCCAGSWGWAAGQDFSMGATKYQVQIHHPPIGGHCSPLQMHGTPFHAAVMTFANALRKPKERTGATSSGGAVA